ncbi:MAG: hypothetical protein QOG87_2543 [Actinomycetota bacterium]|jgi:hypothetical protein
MPIEGIGARRAQWVVGLVVLTVGIVSATVVASAGASTSAAFVEGPNCDAPPPTIPHAPAGTIVFFNPPTVFVRVDADGSPAQVTTNTGCAPRTSDRFLIEIGGGPEAVGAPSELVDIVMALTFSGDWRETGRWHEV